MTLTNEQLAQLIESPEIAALETDAEKIAALNADKRTHSDMQLGPLNVFLNESGISLTLLAMRDDEQVPEAYRSAIARFLLHMQDFRQQWFATAKKHNADEMADLVSLLQSQEMVTPEQVDQLYALGGGLRVPEEVTSQAYDDAVAWIWRRDAMAALIQESRHRQAAFVSLCEAWAATGEGDEPTIGEL